MKVVVQKEVADIVHVRIRGAARQLSEDHPGVRGIGLGVAALAKFRSAGGFQSRKQPFSLGAGAA